MGMRRLNSVKEDAKQASSELAVGTEQLSVRGVRGWRL